MASDHLYSADIVSAFIAPIEDAFDVLCGTAAHFDRSMVRLPGYVHPSGTWIGGIITLRSKTMTGGLVLNLPDTIALRVVSVLLGKTLIAITPEVIDGVGELSNIVAGSVTTHLSRQGVFFEIGLPQVVHGNGHTVGKPGHPCLWLNFTLWEIPFFIDVALVRASQGSDRLPRVRPSLQPA